MPVTQVTTDARAAAAALNFATEMCGNPVNAIRMSVNNAAFILPLRDAVIAAGKPANDPMVTAINDAHYAASNAQEWIANPQGLLLIEKGAAAIMAGVTFVEGTTELVAGASRRHS